MGEKKKPKEDDRGENDHATIQPSSEPEPFSNVNNKGSGKTLSITLVSFAGLVLILGSGETLNF